MFFLRPYTVSIALMFAVLSATSYAGMPSALPSDLATRWEQSAESTLRLESISFFCVGLLASILAVKFLWNSLASVLPSIPRIDFLRSFAIVALWGLVFTLVLTMISGARELLTPGAWKQNGFTYELGSESELSNEPQPSGSPVAQEADMP